RRGRGREGLPASYPAGSRSTLSSLAAGRSPYRPAAFLFSARMRADMNRDEVLKALEVVIDPELRRSIVELEMVRSIDISENGVVDVTVSLTTAGCPIRGHFQTSVAEAVSALEGVTPVNVYFAVLSDSEKVSLPQGGLSTRGRHARERLLRRAQRQGEGLPASEARPLQPARRSTSTGIQRTL